MKVGSFKPGADELSLGLVESGEDDDGFHLAVSVWASAKTMMPAPVWTVLWICTSALLADVRLAVVDDDHGAVGQIADALALVLAFADDFQMQNFAGKHHFEAIGDFVKVDTRHFCKSATLARL